MPTKLNAKLPATPCIWNHSCCRPSGGGSPCYPPSVSAPLLRPPKNIHRLGSRVIIICDNSVNHSLVLESLISVKNCNLTL